MFLSFRFCLYFSAFFEGVTWDRVTVSLSHTLCKSPTSKGRDSFLRFSWNCFYEFFSSVYWGNGDDIIITVIWTKNNNITTWFTFRLSMFGYSLSILFLKYVYGSVYGRRRYVFKTDNFHVQLHKITITI